MNSEVHSHGAFSECGNYFVICGSDGKLKIWDTATGNLKQEYTPNLHLTSPCTCLTWMVTTCSTSLHRKKRKNKSDSSSPEESVIALGTRSGLVVLYSVAAGDVVSSLQGGHNAAVTSVAWARGSTLFSAASDDIVHWDLPNRRFKNKWKSGPERVTGLLVSPDGKSVVSACMGIKLWDVATGSVVKTYIGHSSEVVAMAYVPLLSGDHYFLSAAANDRIISAWSLSRTSSDRTAVASFAVSDCIRSISASVSSEGVTNMAAVTRSGVLHFFTHQLNGKCKKPLKAKQTVQIACEGGANKTAVHTISLLDAKLFAKSIARISYGIPPILAFEHIELGVGVSELCLVRQEPRRVAATQQSISKVKAGEVTEDVEYLTPAAIQCQSTSNTSMHKKKGKHHVPMEERLDNLAINAPTSTSDLAQPKGENMAHLLIQGLRSKDRSILQSVLFVHDETLIANTVSRLPVQAIVPLLKELSALIQGRTWANQMTTVWLRNVIKQHASQLIANSDVIELLSPLLGLVETRLAALGPLCRLRGRLDLLLEQFTESSKRPATELDSQALLVYQDQDSSEDESELGDGNVSEHSEEEHWDELSDDDLVEEDDSEDVAMSN